MNGSARWYTKKAARHVLAASTRHVTTALHRGAPGVRVLTYHRFGSVARDAFCIEPLEFGRQLGYLAEAQLAISLSDLRSFLAGQGAVPVGAVLVTIDDGAASVAEHALPLLRLHDVPAVAFVSVAGIEAGSQPGEPEPYMGWTDLGRLGDSGVEVASHGWTHRSLAKMPLAQMTEELGRSRDLLKAKLGVEASALAYPYGTRADYDEDTCTAVAEAGYSLAFTSQHGRVLRTACPLELPRIKVEGGDARWVFPAAVRGGLDAWQVIDRCLWRLQQPRR
jgi:peptidoglycan/xylan/chitin deacetylase (PgdA/CDA1 family)